MNIEFIHKKAKQIPLSELKVGEAAIITSDNDLVSRGNLVICCTIDGKTRIVDLNNSHIWGMQIQNYRCRKVSMNVQVEYI